MGANGWTGEATLAWQHLPDHAVADFAALEIAARRHRVPCAFSQAIARKIDATRIAQKNEATALRKAAQPSGDPLRHRLFVANIAGGDDAPRFVDGVDKFCGCDSHPDVVHRRIHRTRGSSETIDVGGERASRSDFGRSDRDETGAGAEIEHETSSNLFGMVEEITRQRLPADPREGPKRRRHRAAGQNFLS